MVFKELAPRDGETQRQLTRLALEKLGRTAVAMGGDNFLRDALIVPNSGNFYGICVLASSALTSGAHELGYAAARQLTIGGHCFTSFAKPDARPADDDLVGCMTLRQYDGARDSLGVNPDQVLGGAPFFGPRRELMRLVGPDADSYAAAGVIFHQLTHRPDAHNPELPHEWLMTKPGDLQARPYPTGQVDATHTADRPWCSGYPDIV
jgi:hypothetical protein